MPDPRTYALYWHNGRTLGHTAESAKVAQRLSCDGERPSVAGLTGAYHGLDLLPDFVDVIKLPSFTNYDRGDGWHLHPRLNMPTAELHRLRAEMARTFLLGYQPDMFIVNHLPRGSDDELVPALTGRSSGHNVLTLRGVLFDPDKTEREYFAPEPAAWLAERFCQINIHTHPDVFSLEEFYKPPACIAERFHYTGYLSRPAASSRGAARDVLGLDAGERVAICAMGGGQGAGGIWQRLTEALRRYRDRFDRLLLVTGPFLEPPDLRSLQRAWQDDPAVRVETYLPDLPLWMQASDLFVGAAGANMLGEVLANGCNAVVVPRQIRENEQHLHAERLTRLGLVRWVPLCRALAGEWDMALGAAFDEPLTIDAGKFLSAEGPYQPHLPGDGKTRCSCPRGR